MILILLANGFEECEALVPADLLMRAGFDVRLVSVADSLWVKGTHGINIEANALLEDINDFGTLEMVVLPGGMPGAENLYNNEKVRSLVLFANEKKLPIGAICAAPFILGELGLLTDKNATCFPGFESRLKCKEYIPESKTVTDGNILTSRGMGAAFDFGIEAVAMLAGREKAQNIRKATMA